MVSITPVATQWFDKKRGLALVRLDNFSNFQCFRSLRCCPQGIGGGGSGAGGLLFSNVTRIMLERTSLKWAFLLK